MRNVWAKGLRAEQVQAERDEEFPGHGQERDVAQGDGAEDRQAIAAGGSCAPEE